MSNLWIYTPDGFYSARQDDWCEEDEVMIRSRVYEDLIALADAVGIEKPKIIRIPRGDYLYRMKIKVDQWKTYCGDAAMNFDDGPGIKDFEDMDRYMAYLEVWEIMQWLQSIKDVEFRGEKRLAKKMRDDFAEEHGYVSFFDEPSAQILLGYEMYQGYLAPKAPKRKDRRRTKRGRKFFRTVKNFK